MELSGEGLAERKGALHLSPFACPFAWVTTSTEIDDDVIPSGRRRRMIIGLLFLPFLRAVLPIPVSTSLVVFVVVVTARKVWSC